MDGIKNKTVLKQLKDKNTRGVQTSLTTSHGEKSCRGMNAATSMTITKISQKLAPMML